jgi:stearoyl-CoA desaturase (delta-9 desaturase)
MFLNYIALDLFVYLTHKYGYRNHDTRDNSRNNWFISLILWGEGWHNNHHNNPRDWNLQHHWYEIDICSWVIRLVKK